MGTSASVLFVEIATLLIKVVFASHAENQIEASLLLNLKRECHVLARFVKTIQSMRNALIFLFYTVWGLLLSTVALAAIDWLLDEFD